MPKNKLEWSKALHVSISNYLGRLNTSNLSDSESRSLLNQIQQRQKQGATFEFRALELVRSLSTHAKKFFPGNPFPAFALFRLKELNWMLAGFHQDEEVASPSVEAICRWQSHSCTRWHSVSSLLQTHCSQQSKTWHRGCAARSLREFHAPHRSRRTRRTPDVLLVEPMYLNKLLLVILPMHYTTQLRKA